jgi:rhodanese-related sulfurtransferase
MGGLFKVLTMGWFASLLGGCTPVHISGLDAREFEHVFKTRKVPSLLVDVRTAEEFHAGHLSNALHAPLERLATTLETVLAARKPQGDVLLFAYAGDAAATERLKTELAGLLNGRRKGMLAKVRSVQYLEGGYAAVR